MEHSNKTKIVFLRMNNWSFLGAKGCLFMLYGKRLLILWIALNNRKKSFSAYKPIIGANSMDTMHIDILTPWTW